MCDAGVHQDLLQHEPVERDLEAVLDLRLDRQLMSDIRIWGSPWAARDSRVSRLAGNLSQAVPPR